MTDDVPISKKDLPEIIKQVSNVARKEEKLEKAGKIERSMIYLSNSGDAFEEQSF